MIETLIFLTLVVFTGGAFLFFSEALPLLKELVELLKRLDNHLRK